MLPIVPGVSLVQNTPGALVIQDVVRLNGKWGVEYDLAAVTQPGPSDFYLYNNSDLSLYDRANYSGDIQFTLNGSVQTGFEMITTSDLSSPGQQITARARSTVTSNYSDYSAPFSIQTQPLATFNAINLIETNILYGTNANWSGSKYYALIDFNYDELTPTDITNTRGRKFYVEGSFTRTSEPSGEIIPAFQPAYLGTSIIADAALYIPLGPLGSNPVDQANITTFYGFYPAFDTEPEYNIEIIAEQIIVPI